VAEQLKLMVTAEGMPPEDLAKIARELDAWILRTAPGVVTTAPKAKPVREGDKGSPVEVGTLLLALINAGAATALINCLATYIKERRRSVKLEISDPNGRKLSLAADNVGDSQIKGLVSQMSRMANPAGEVTK
jgi:hypothetical protein